MNNFFTKQQSKLLWAKEGWIMWRAGDGRPDLPKNSIIDYWVTENCVTGIGEQTAESMDDNFCWTSDSAVICYRLTNNKYFKDGIYNGYTDETDESDKHYRNWAASSNPLTYQEALEEQKKHDGIAIDDQKGCKITQMKEQKAVADEATCSAIETLKTLGYTWHGGQLWTPPIGPKPDFDSTGYKLRALFSNNEAMEAIALAACEEQQKVIDKAKVIEAAIDEAIKAENKFLENGDYCQTMLNLGDPAKRLIDSLYDAKMLSMPEGDNND